MSNLRYNIKNMRFDLSEFSGGLGDLGTFIPLAAAMSIVGGMDIAVILLFAGLFNIVTGLLFGLPIPVQPMKAIAAVAIAESLAPGEIAAAGLIAGAVILVLGSTGLTERLENVIPRAVVRGIQLGVGAKLFLKGSGFILSTPLWGLDSIMVATFLTIAVALVVGRPKIPSALILFFIGVAVVVIGNPSLFSQMSIGLVEVKGLIPSTNDWFNGLIHGAIPQLPLTLLNSVIAVCVLSGDLFPGRRILTGKMAVSVGLMNLIGCWFGAMPMCHGSGGLAGQYRFGARTGGSVVILGIAKLTVGLFFGASAIVLLNAYPISILGVLLLFAGIELGRPALDQKSVPAIAVVLMTAAGIVLWNTLAGFIIGIAAALALKSRLTSRIG